MKRKLVGIFVCTLLMFTIVPITASSNVTLLKTITVDDDPGKDFTSIQDAIDFASDGDTIYVYSGTYRENIEIAKSIQLIGEDRENTIIDGDGSGDVVHISANEVKFTEFTIQNSGSELVDTGIHIKSNYNIISGNIIQNCPIGMYFFSSESNIITNNIFQNIKNYCIALGFSNKNTIKSNTIASNISSDECMCGLIMMLSKENDISYNKIQNNGIGIILFLSSNKNKIQYNSFKQNIINVFFYKSYNNNFNRNYWDRPHLLPKPIFGTIGLLGYIPRIKFDWRPLLTSYEL